MKGIGYSLAVLAVCAGMARAEVAAEAIPADILQQLAPVAVQLVQAQFPDAAVKVDADAGRAVGFHVQEKVGIMVIPDKAISAKAIEEAKDKEVPVGIISTRSLSVEDAGKIVDGDRLAVADFNGQFKLPIFFVSVKAEGADRILKVFSKGSKTVTTVPMKKVTGDASIPVQLKLQNIDIEKMKSDVVITVGGGWEATVKLAFLQ